MRLLTISGSLRQASTNSQLMTAVGLLAPSGVRVVSYEELGLLPHFNPDLDVEPAPPTVQRLRAAIAAADAVIISSPEYAHGVPGTLKNALDWLVSGAEIIDKPIGLLNGSARSVYAQAALLEILTTMSARVVPEASRPVPLLGRGMTAEQIAAVPEFAVIVHAAILALMPGR